MAACGAAPAPEREKSLVAQKLSPAADALDAQMKYDEYRVELESAGNAATSWDWTRRRSRILMADGLLESPAYCRSSATSGTVIEKHLNQGETGR